MTTRLERTPNVGSQQNPKLVRNGKSTILHFHVCILTYLPLSMKHDICIACIANICSSYLPNTFCATNEMDAFHISTFHICHFHTCTLKKHVYIYIHTNMYAGKCESFSFMKLTSSIIRVQYSLHCPLELTMLLSTRGFGKQHP